MDINNPAGSGRAYIKYIVSMLFFGSNGYVASFLSLSSYETVVMRAVLGFVFLAAMYFLTGHKADFFKYKRDIFFIGVSGIAMAANWLFLFEGYATIGMSLSILINYFGPAIVILLSPVVLKEKIVLRKVAALAAALIGVIMISGSAAVNGINARGLICVILSAFSYAAMILTNKKCKNVTGMDNSMLQLFFTMTVVCVYLGIKQGFYIPVKSGEIFPVLWIGLINTGFACYLYFSSLGSIPAQSVSILGYLEPLSGVIFAALLLKEKMTAIQIIGAVLVIGGAMYGELGRKEKVRKA